MATSTELLRAAEHMRERFFVTAVPRSTLKRLGP